MIARASSSAAACCCARRCAGSPAADTPEIFTAASLLLVVATAALMQAVGLSMALGAFLAGVLLAESEYRHELETDIEPFKGLLLGLFFIAVGMSIDFAVVLAQPLLIAADRARLPAASRPPCSGRWRAPMPIPQLERPVFIILLAQGGEFGFVVFQAAAQAGVIDAPASSLLVAAVAISMLLTPLLLVAADRWWIPLLAGGSARAEAARRGAARAEAIGVLMGTAYLFTEEAVAAGAITARVPVGRRRAAQRTVLLETSPGHATRCVETDYVRTLRRAQGRAGARRRRQQGDVGRPRAAQPGPPPHRQQGVERAGDDLVEVDDATQAREGMFMIGQVATLRSGVTTIAEPAPRGQRRQRRRPRRGRRAHGAGPGLQPVVARPLDIAIVGMASIFPGAAAPTSWWAIVAGTNSITEVSPERWDPDRHGSPYRRSGAASCPRWRSTRSPTASRPTRWRPSSRCSC